MIVIVLLCIVLFCMVLLCGVILIGYRRHKKVLSARDHTAIAQESEMQIVHGHDIEEAIKRTVTKKEFNRKVDTDQTIYNDGEHSNAETYKSYNDRVGEEKNESMQSHMLSDQTGDFRIGLDKVSSEL